MTRVDWYGDQFLARLNTAVDVGLDAAAEALSSEVRKTLSKTTGRVTGKNATGRNLYRASSPGTPPGTRSGRLRNSIDWNRSGNLRRTVGTNLEYARIHELGGTINHPGGTNYTIGSGGRAIFLSQTKADQLRSQGRFVGRTRPHNIRMPRRPFLVPTLRRMETSGRLQAIFSGTVRRQMGNA